MIQKFLNTLLPGFLLAAFVAPLSVSAHCQVPCGIYDDAARVASMLEDAETVTKAITLINELANETDAQSRQQLVRWVMNKESHAQKIISTISDYFLTQRVKSSQDDYVERLKRHHAVIVAAMKAKQQAEPRAAEDLVEAIEGLKEYYNPADHDHAAATDPAVSRPHTHADGTPAGHSHGT